MLSKEAEAQIPNAIIIGILLLFFVVTLMHLLTKHHC